MASLSGQSTPSIRYGSNSNGALRRPAVFNRDSSSLSIHSNGGGAQDRHDLMVRYIYRKCLQSKWLEPTQAELTDFELDFPGLGVILKRADNTFSTEPVLLNQDVARAVDRLGASVAFTMSSDATRMLLEHINPNESRIRLDHYGSTLPVVESVNELGTAKFMLMNDIHMCLCRKERFVLVWGNNAQEILAIGSDVETQLIGVVWGAPIADAEPAQTRSMNRNSAGSAVLMRRISSSNVLEHERSLTQDDRQSPFDFRKSYLNPMDDASMKEKVNVITAAIEQEELGDKAFDSEKEGQEAPKRAFLLIHAILVALAMALVIIVEMACIAKLLTEWRLDGKMTRFALIATIPLFGTFSVFFMIVITGSLFQLFGPISGVQENSLYYSSKAPKRGRYPDYELPHITIQMPVYKEGLKGVILPSVESIMAAVEHYESQGGTASIYVNDDGMQLVKPELAEARKAFYELNNIGWCSRPAQCTTPGDNYFLRRGHFKKASNMNYCLDFSIRVEDEMLRLFEEFAKENGKTTDDLTVDEENRLYEQARNTIVEGDGGRTRAGGDVRLGEIILIIDSDTRVPVDCLLYGALEMHESPEVALLQHQSGILQVVHNAFENGISYFTNLIYTSIQFAVGNGDVAPFVGHNTFIRWKAIQSIAWYDEEDKCTKFWSDSHVSEDFDVSLRLQMNQFTVRLATYHQGGFKEGVSLTVYDELARWEKYAYGCNELVFHPLYKWPYKGPITPLFRKFLFSNIKITSKITIFAYIGTYYAIASAIPLTLANYLIVGWFADNVDQFYLTSWKIFVGMAVVFNVLSPLGYAMLRHRLGQATFFSSLWETIKWTPMFLLFFGGISFHLLKAILCHFLGVKMEWTTTAKELEASGFRVGLDRIVRDFKSMYVFVFVMIGGMIYLADFAPRGWVINDFAAIVPLANQIGCHALFPFALGLF